VDWSVVYNCCWASPAQSFSGLSPTGFMTTFYSLRFETPQPGGPGPYIYIPQEQGGLVIPPGTGLHFQHLLRHTGLWWRYSTQPPHGTTKLGWCPCYVTSEWTQQKTPPPRILLLLSCQLPSDRLDIVSMRTCLPTVTMQRMFLLVITA
jgi:hypothetical protein